MARKFKTMKRNGHTFVQVRYQKPNGEYSKPVWINARKSAKELANQMQRMNEGKFDYMYSTPPNTPERSSRVARVSKLEDIYHVLYSGIDASDGKMRPSKKLVVKESDGIRYVDNAPGHVSLWRYGNMAPEANGKVKFALSNG